MSFNCEKARLSGLPVNPKSSTMPSISTPPESVKSASSERQSPVLPCKEVFALGPPETNGPVLGVVKQGFITKTTYAPPPGPSK